MARIKAQSMPPRRVKWGVATLQAGQAVVALSDDGAVCRVTLLRGRDAVDIVEEWQHDWTRTSFIMSVVPKNIGRLPLLMVGTPLQVRAWTEIMTLKRGKIATYGEIAKRIGMPRAARAVGMACGKNHLGTIVPCHRVVSSGGIGGYGSDGVAEKRRLLEEEGIIL